MAAKPAPKPAAPAAAGAPADAPKKGFPIVLVLIVLLLGLGAGGGAAWFMLPKGEPEASTEGAQGERPARRSANRTGPLQYLPLAPAFVVNLADEGSPRYLQAEIQVSTRDPQTLRELETHMPAVRNALLMLFARQTQAELRTAEGRERLQEETLAAINGVLEQESGAGGVEGVFFTNFVTQ